MPNDGISAHALFRAVYAQAKDQNEDGLSGDELKKRADKLIAGQGLAVLKAAVQGAAHGGHVAFVNTLIQRGGNPDDAVFGASCGGHVDFINELIHQGASIQEAILGFISGGHAEKAQEDVLRFVAFIDNAELRKKLIEEAKIRNASLDVNSLMKKAAKLNQLVRGNQLTFEQAEIYLKTAANNWFFQGQQMVRNNKLPAELYFHISTFLTGCSLKDTEAVFNAANQRIRDREIQEYNKGFFSIFRSRKKQMEHEKTVEQRYQDRLTF